MTSIQVRNNGKEQAAAPLAPPNAWEPSRWITRMMGWDPFREMTPFVPDLRLSLDAAFEVKETKDSYVFKADVPGIKQSDIDVSLTGNRLTIAGKREAEKEDKHDTYYAYERTYGSFSRSFTLPEGVNSSAIVADLRDGVLSVILPKTPEAQPKKIAVNAEPKKA